MADQITALDNHHAYQMELGSTALLHRLKREAGEPHDIGKVHLRSNKLVWRDAVYSGSDRTDQSRRYQEERAAAHMAERDEALARVVKRDPCTRCGTRADVGCKHRRVA